MTPYRDIKAGVIVMTQRVMTIFRCLIFGQEAVGAETTLLCRAQQRQSSLSFRGKEGRSDVYDLDASSTN